MIVDRVRDGLRTARTVGAFFGGMIANAVRAGGGGDGGRTTATPHGLAHIQAGCRGHLARLGVEVVVEHIDRVPVEGGVVFLWNQTSHLDHLVLPLAMPRPFFSLYNNAVRRVPLYGRYMERSGHVWVDRTDETQWRAQIARAAARVSAGECVLLSPEGTRSRDGRLLPMKRGAFQLARTAARPIVCVTVIGAHALLPRGRATVKPGRVRIVLSAPIPVDATTSPELEPLVVRTFETTLAG